MFCTIVLHVNKQIVRITKAERCFATLIESHFCITIKKSPGTLLVVLYNFLTTV